MSAAVAERLDASELRRLYGRYKSLLLAAAAALVLDEPTADLAAATEALHVDCRAAAGSCPPELKRQLDACAAAAGELEVLVRGGADGCPDVEAARATHRALRREVWKVLPCEYVPCGAELHVHDHGGENDG